MAPILRSSSGLDRPTKPKEHEVRTPAPWKTMFAILALAACLTALPAQAKIEPVRIGHVGTVDIAAQSTPRPAEQAPGPERDDAVLGRGESGLSWVVGIVVLLGAIAAAAWWWPKFQRSRRDGKPPITPSRGPAQSDREPGGH